MFRHPLMLSCQHHFCIACLKTLLDNDSWICPYCRCPIEVKFSDLERPRAIIDTMNIFKRGITDLKQKDLDEIYESAKLIEKRKTISKSDWTYSSRWYIDWSILYYIHILLSYFFN